MRNKLLYLTHMAVLITFAVVIHAVEAALPLPMPVPGVRLGLANIMTLLTLLLYGLRSGLLVAVLRTVLGSLITGTFLGVGFWLSLSGGVAACLAMGLAAVLYRRRYLSVLSVSVLGAAAHNLAQLGAAAALIASPALLRGYYPLLLLLALPAGIFTGLAAFYLEGLAARASLRAGGPAGAGE